MNLQIIRSGPMTTVQDEGRFGYMEYGIGESGVMDRDAYRRANELVGNTAGEAVLEATLMGPVIRFDGDALIAFMGADMQADIDGTAIYRGQAYQVAAGHTVQFGFSQNGVRTYIAVAGGIDVPVIMGSRSTNMKCKIGGFWGRKLEDNDVLQVFERSYSNKEKSRLLKKKITPEVYGAQIEVRAIPGPQDDYFTAEGIKTFFETGYRVSQDSDRMGIRLDGAEVEGKGSMDIVSDGITFGSVQVTSAGLPIVLMADHQTTGGYAKIATVVSEDLHYLAQARPGDEVRFKEVTIKDMLRHRNILGKITGKH